MRIKKGDAIIAVLLCTVGCLTPLISGTGPEHVATGLSSTDSAVTVTIPVGAYELTTTSQGDELSITNYGCLSIPGEPMLPTRIFSIAIPPGALVQGVSYETKNGVCLHGSYRIPPCPIPGLMGEQNPAFFIREETRYQENYKAVYGSNTPFPSSVCETVGTGGYRKYNLVDVRITPCQYLPLTGMVRYYPDITVTVHYSFPKAPAARTITSDTTRRTERLAQQIILNYDQAQDWYAKDASTGREQFDYVIITLDKLTSSVTPLADWENLKGRSVAVVTASWINATYEGYDLAAKIRAFLLEKYPSSAWGIQDVLLVGNRDDLPMRRMAQNISGGEPETDYYYAELSLPDNESWDANGNHLYGETYYDPIDFKTEVNVGRIPWSDPDIVHGICEKSAAYEQNNHTEYKKNILLLGAFYESSTDNAVLMEYKVNASHNPWMSDWNKTRMYELGYSNYSMDYDLSYENVKTIWSTGTYGFVDWAGHGSPTECVRLYPNMADFVNTETCPYLNDTHPSIIFAAACSNADSDHLNLGQMMMKQGAVGFLGSNKIAICRLGWKSPTWGSSQTMDYYFTSCCTSMNYTQGLALQWSLHEMYVQYHWNNLNYETFEWGSLWGNPDLTMGPVTTSDPPYTPPAPSGPTHGTIYKNYTFSSTTTDPNGDDISYMFDWGDGTPHTWLGPVPSGTTVSETHAWALNATYNVTVKAKDAHNVSSHWSEALPVTIVVNDPPDTPTLAGPGTGKPGIMYLYTFRTTDSEGDNVFYFLEWGDNTTTGWLGPYPSDAQESASHSWSQKGTYIIKVKAKDSLGYESDWGTLPVHIPMDTILVSIFPKTLERFANASPILRYVVGWYEGKVNGGKT
jgi:hypothetical protein